MRLLEFPHNMRVEIIDKDDKSIIGKCFVGKCFVGNKAKKPKWHYRFKSESQFNSYCLKTLNEIESSLKIKEERKIQNKQNSDELLSKIKVGSIFSVCYGYSMTIYEFHQVVSIKGSKVEIHRIGVDRRPASGWEQYYVRPIPGTFIGESQSKIIRNGAISFGDRRGYLVEDLTKDFYENRCD